jgi:hypothetical protein
MKRITPMIPMRTLLMAQFADWMMDCDAGAMRV